MPTTAARFTTTTEPRVSPPRPLRARELFETFRQEVAAVEKVTGCRGKITPPGDGFGAPYGCIKGRAQTAKLFVNERAGTGQVNNVKVMWNDWFQDRGHGTHADGDDARQLLEGVLSRYAGSSKSKIAPAFFGNEGRVFTEGPFTFTYTYRRGPAIDERLLVIRQR
jgi:hypothetical protein